MPEITYKCDEDSGLIVFFVDGSELATWVYEDDPENCLHEFKKIYKAGFDAGQDS